MKRAARPPTLPLVEGINLNGGIVGHPELHCVALVQQQEFVWFDLPEQAQAQEEKHPRQGERDE